MKKRIVFVALMALALIGLLSGMALAAQGDTKQVGLVIAFPDKAEYTAIVTVPVTATTFDVLQAANVELLSQSTSFGPAVCSIKGVGCPADNCFCDAKRFWAYFHLVDGAWVSAAEGAGSFVPADGAVEGFAWSESDADFNPLLKPTVLTFAQIAAGPVPVSLPKTGAPLLPVAAGGLLLAGALIAASRRARR